MIEPHGSPSKNGPVIKRALVGLSSEIERAL